MMLPQRPRPWRQARAEAREWFPLGFDPEHFDVEAANRVLVTGWKIRRGGRKQKEAQESHPEE